jgi:hypothetical protein
MKTPREALTERYSNKSYIGDSVYIHFDGYHFILETHNGYCDDPRNRIALEPSVLTKLNEYKKSCYEDFEKLIEWENKNEHTNHK